ncbi:MAG TPA: hypothetical protein VFL14_10005 [Xanthomonadales bacterium]|nr:hypothetical protein [Xanthomonadales bacterium]
MDDTKQRGGAVTAVLKVVNRIALLGLLAILGYAAWRVIGGDASLPLGSRVIGQIGWLFAAVPLFFVAIVTFIVRGLMLGTLKPSGGNSAGFDMDTSANSSSSFGSMND